MYPGSEKMGSLTGAGEMVAAEVPSGAADVEAF